MGTRSITTVMDGDDAILTMYIQYDGYPEGVGAELAEFLKGITVVNGYSGDMAAGTHANGMGCLAAQIVSKFKEGIGGVYLMPASPNAGQEYEYVVTLEDDTLHITAHASSWRDGSRTETLFSGTPEQYLAWLAVR